MEWILHLILRVYPSRFRLEFGEEIAAVFRQSAAEKSTQGWLALAGWLLAELYGGLRVGLYLRLAGLKKGANMETSHAPARDDQAPFWAVLAIFGFFLFLGLPNRFYASFPNWMAGWLMFGLALLAFVGPLLVGIFTRLPRWSMLYTGTVLGGVGFYCGFIILGIPYLLFRSILLPSMNQLISPDTLLGGLFYEWINHGLGWLGVLLANGIFFALVAYAPVLRGQKPRFWRDLSWVSFSLYGGILITYLIDFDDYTHEELYQFASMLALALGAWGYLRARTVGMRTLALLAGLTVCMAIMGVGKFFLVPLQDWSPWLPGHPPESQRWFESLRTIATWFWIALSIGLSGLFQALRKTTSSLPPAAPA